MMNGASTLEGHVPSMDATVVTRILDAAPSPARRTAVLLPVGRQPRNATGPVHNPHRHGYIAGGSSSGCGALVSSGEVDMAIGGDGAVPSASRLPSPAATA